MGGEQRRLRLVVTGLHAAAGPFGDVAGQHRIRGRGVPPVVPVLAVPAGEAPLVLALAQPPVQAALDSIDDRLSAIERHLGIDPGGPGNVVPPS
jgi:hypothetical protein